MVAENPPSLTEPLISDILRALALSPDQVLQLTPDRVAMLPQDSRCNSWRLGCGSKFYGIEGTSPQSRSFIFYFLFFLLLSFFLLKTF